MKKFISLIIVGFIIFLSCDNHKGCYVFNPGGTLEDVVNTNDGFYQILIMCPVDSVKSYDVEKSIMIEDEVYGSYMKKLMKMSLLDRYELLTVLDSVYRDRMLEERLWHIKRINGLTGEISIEYKW